MEKEVILKKISFLEDMMMHYEEDYIIGMMTREEYNSACKDTKKEIKELKKMLEE